MAKKALRIKAESQAEVRCSRLHPLPSVAVARTRSTANSASAASACANGRTAASCRVCTRVPGVSSDQRCADAEQLA